MDKIIFDGDVLAVQPRIRLNRSFDERSHSYLGYAVLMYGGIGAEEAEGVVGIKGDLQHRPAGLACCRGERTYRIAWAASVLPEGGMSAYEPGVERSRSQLRFLRYALDRVKELSDPTLGQKEAAELLLAGFQRGNRTHSRSACSTIVGEVLNLLEFDVGKVGEDS